MTLHRPVQTSFFLLGSELYKRSPQCVVHVLVVFMLSSFGKHSCSVRRMIGWVAVFQTERRTSVYKYTRPHTRHRVPHAHFFIYNWDFSARNSFLSIAKEKSRYQMTFTKSLSLHGTSWHEHLSVTEAQNLTAALTISLPPIDKEIPRK